MQLSSTHVYLSISEYHFCHASTARGTHHISLYSRIGKVVVIAYVPIVDVRIWRHLIKSGDNPFHKWILKKVAVWVCRPIATSYEKYEPV